jgi:GAF domain-containing protein
MALPLKVGERVIGVLDVQSTEPAAFTEEDVTVLQIMADQIALAIENARLLLEAQDRLREVTSLTREYARREWAQLVSERPDWGYIYDGIEVRPGRPPSDSSGAPPALTLPLQAPGGETIGRLLIALPDRAPASEEMALAQAVAEQAALALESARLFQQTQRTLQEMETLYRATQAINAAGTPDEVLRAFTDHVVPPQIGRCVLALLDPHSPPDEPNVEIVAAWERGVERSPSLGRRWSVHQIPFIARNSSRPMAISNLETYPDIDEVSRHAFQKVLGVQALLSIPLMIGSRLLGWLLGESLTGPYEFQEEEIRLYRTLADQAAQALERMRLFEETQRRAEWERLRAEVSARVRASTDVDTILRTAVRELGRAFRATEGVIQLHGGDGRSGTEEQRG